MTKFSPLQLTVLVCLSVLGAALFLFDSQAGIALATAGGASLDVILKACDSIEEKLKKADIEQRVLADRLQQLEQRPGAMDADPAATRRGPADPDAAGQLLLRSAQDMRNHYTGERLALGEFLRGIAGMKTTERATKALSVGTDTAGGYAVPRATFGEILGAMLPVSALMSAGVGITPVGDAKTVTTAVVNAIPTAAWRSESGAIAESDPTFRAVVATPQSLSFRFKVSRELLADAPNMEAALAAVIGQALAKELDRAGLRGSGTLPEPRGLLNTAGIYTVGSGADGSSGPGYDTILSVYDDILGADGPMPTAAIMAPRSWVRLMTGVDTTGQPKAMPKALENLRMVASSQVPINLTVGGSTDCSELYVGDFSKMSLMIRETASFQRLDELYAENGQIGFVGHVRADVAVWYPAAFAVVTGLR